MRHWLKARQAIAYIKHFIGLPYIYGGDDPMAGFDCSGLAIEMLKSVGLFPLYSDMTAQDLFHYHSNYIVDMTKPFKPGMLIFYGTALNEISHVSIVLNKNQILEAGGGRSTTKTIGDAIRQNAYIMCRPISKRENEIIGVVDPFIKR